PLPVSAETRTRRRRLAAAAPHDRDPAARPIGAARPARLRRRRWQKRTTAAGAPWQPTLARLSPLLCGALSARFSALRGARQRRLLAHCLPAAWPRDGDLAKRSLRFLRTVRHQARHA